MKGKVLVGVIDSFIPIHYLTIASENPTIHNKNESNMDITKRKYNYESMLYNFS